MSFNRERPSAFYEAVSAKNRQLVLEFQEALSKSDLMFVEAGLDRNFVYVRLRERFSRYEYLEALTRTLFLATNRTLSVRGCIADSDRVALEVSMEFYFADKCVRGQYHSVYELEEGKITMLREYGGLLD
jgi:ketosteroid isomerase-like protein